MIPYVVHDQAWDYIHVQASRHRNEQIGKPQVWNFRELPHLSTEFFRDFFAGGIRS
jgi:hypothetical protein